MERLDSRVRIVWLATAVLTGLVVGALAGVGNALTVEAGLWIGPATWLVLAAAGAGHALLHYRRWRFEVRTDALYIDRGVVTRVTTVAPYVRVQHVDVRRGPIERLLGLASVVVYTAGSRGADVSIPGLTPDRADDLQERLRDLAIESEGEDAV